MGEGVESPFRIRPFIGAKIPRDSNYKTVLKLHNPEPEPMQIIQWYASTSRLQLEPIGNWLIEPFEDKIIGDMSFLGKDTTGLQVKYLKPGRNQIRQKSTLSVCLFSEVKNDLSIV